MKLVASDKGFKEIVNAYDHYGTSMNFGSGKIPADCTLSIEVYEDYSSVCIYRLHPYNEKVMDARRDQVAYSDLRSSHMPTTKFAVEGWTPEKLAEVQARTVERVAKYNDFCAKHKVATQAYNEALEAQRLEILGGQPDENL